MALSKEEFKAIYEAKSREFTGSEPSGEEVEKHYKYYLELKRFDGRDGVPVFRKEGTSGMTWAFKPLLPT